ncbi:centromere protein L [Danaus plexippus plexippus]|uniref:Centromere protein L n=2 Tax=Danaus plexippus TaxID=13037 RepID=A0A212EVG4_DANPL|nr:centromere protein L [Danaus plexippus plexippus]
MHNLQYSEIKLKQYAFKIRQTFVSTVATNVSQKYTVQVENLPLLKFSEEDSNGLMITVSSTTQDNKTKLVYSAILLSWGVSVNINDAIHLPYMLDRGEQRVGTTVKNTLQTLFDCNIKQYNFTQHQLLQFGFSFIEHDTSRSTDPFVLIYKTPQVNFKDKLTLTFDVGDLHIIWNGIKEEVNRESEQVTLAYQILQNQIYHTLTLDITVFDLCEVILSKAEVKSNGVLKMKTPEIVNAVFTVLNEITGLEA